MISSLRQKLWSEFFELTGLTNSFADSSSYPVNIEIDYSWLLGFPERYRMVLSSDPMPCLQPVPAGFMLYTALKISMAMAQFLVALAMLVVIHTWARS